MLVYVSGKYTADTFEKIEQNVNKAIDIGIEVIKKGHEVIVPHLSHWLDLRAREIGVELGWQDFMNSDVEIVKRCDAILYISSSKGADIELNTAIENGLKVFTSVDEL